MADTMTRIYEGSFLNASAVVPASDTEYVEEVTFRFCKDGEQFKEQVIPLSGGDDTAEDSAEEESASEDGTTDAEGGSEASEGSGSTESDEQAESADSGTGGSSEDGGTSTTATQPDGSIQASCAVRAPEVPDEKDGYILDFHFFYKTTGADGSTETRQQLSVKMFEVLPRTGQLKVTRASDGEPFPQFSFRVVQGRDAVGVVRQTFSHDTKNAKDETVPAGTAEFDLALAPGFRIVQEPPFEITEEVVTSGRKQEVKGKRTFKAAFIAPESGRVRQYVNADVEGQGLGGMGHEVAIKVGVEGDEDRLEKLGDEETEIHFRVTFGPESGAVPEKSARDDSENPTKVLKVDDADEGVSIEEKEAGKKYEGKVTLTDGSGRFMVALGKAGGDTCKVEISGSDKFLTDDAVSADETLEFENWRRVHYEFLDGHWTRARP